MPIDQKELNLKPDHSRICLSIVLEKGRASTRFMMFFKDILC